jgi:hypothetical protein
MHLPPLLRDRPPVLRVLLAGVVPVAFGLLTGYLLGKTEAGYLICSLLGILGGFAAGIEHPTAQSGGARGLMAGALFGSSILLGHALEGSEPTAHLPEPEIILVVITTVLGGGLGWLGGRTRARREAAPEPAK